MVREPRLLKSVIPISEEEISFSSARPSNMYLSAVLHQFQGFNTLLLASRSRAPLLFTSLLFYFLSLKATLIIKVDLLLID
jgi:hypothetical protein